jgi:class 3 adenylate cyclase
VSEILIALIAVAVLALVAFALFWVRPRIEQRRHERQVEAEEKRAEEDFDRLVESSKATVQNVLQTASRVRDEGLGSIVRGSLDQLMGWAEEDESELKRMAGRDGTLAILFSDIEDSTATNERVGDRAWLRILSAHDRVVRDRVERHSGHVVKSQGDGFMIVFSEPEPAVRCAVDIERGIADGGRRLRKAEVRVRIGIHVGKAVAKDGDIFGTNVALAARVAGEAEGGEILVSSEVAEAAGELDDVSYGDPREVELKGLEGEHELLAVHWD